MSRLIYIATARLPNEKAHGYQIVQMCEAFAQAGQDVTLVIPWRINTEKNLRGIKDIWGYYDVRHNFEVRRLPCLDLIWLLDNRFALLLLTVTFIFSLYIWLPFQRARIIFSRDPFILAALSLGMPRKKLVYEVHHKFRSSRGLRLQRWLLRRVRHVISMTGAMAEQLRAMGCSDILVAHDAVRPERFATMPTQTEARHLLKIPSDAFIACYAGRLHTMEMDKGLATFVEAAALAGDIHFLLVGGPAENAEALRKQWIALNLPPEDFIELGTLPPAEVPNALAAADVCLITSPYNEFFAHETSPMKLFEYMFAGRAIVASDLPSTREVVQHRESAYLVPPSDVQALAQALETLRDDPDLRTKMGEYAAQEAQKYTWLTRAETILGNISEKNFS